jgi:hypothetical protein
MRNAFKKVNREPEGKRLLGIYRRRWEDTIKINMGKEIRC